MISTRVASMVALSALGTIGPCSKDSPAPATGSAASVSTAPAAATAGSGNSERWMTNGATACEKFLTPDVAGAILARPGGAAQKDDAHSCHLGPIYISLSAHSLDVFRLEIPHVALTHPLSGVGDAAYWNQAGAISAVKAPDRQCNVSVIVPGAAKLKDEALGEKLGEVCNKLFALP